MRKQKEAEGALRFFCLRPHLRDSRCPKAVGCPFGVRVNPHFPKCRPDPILLPESFCVPLRRRGPRGLSRNPSSDRYAVEVPEFLYRKTKKRWLPALDFVQIEYNTRPLQSQAKAPERRRGLPQSRFARQLPQRGSLKAFPAHGEGGRAAAG